MPRLTGSTHSPPRIEQHFSCVHQIRKILLLHLAREFVILDLNGEDEIL